MNIEIGDFPIKNGGSFHSYVSLPEGMSFILKPFDTGLSTQRSPHDLRPWIQAGGTPGLGGAHSWDEAGRDEASFKLVSVLFFSYKYIYIYVYHLVMTNIAMERSTMLLRTVSHLFRLGPSKNHGKLLVITRGYFFHRVFSNGDVFSTCSDFVMTSWTLLGMIRKKVQRRTATVVFFIMGVFARLIWLWINTYENTIFSGMNIHKSQLWLGVH